MIEVTLKQDVVMTGHRIEGEIRWMSDAPKRILVAAEWQATAFHGTKRGVGRSMVVTPRTGEHQGAFPVRMLIPHEGPASFDGQLIQIRWTLWVRIERPGLDEFANCDFRVVPGRASRLQN